MIIFLPAPMLPSALDGWSMSCLSWRDEPMELPKMNRHHYTDTKGEGKSQPIRRMPQYYRFHAPDAVFSPPEGNFPPYRNFSDRFPILTAGIFPPCRNFPFIFPFPGLDFTAFIYIPGKLPSLLTEGIPAYLMQNKRCGCQ
jgi:hypothetical protein